VTTARLVDRSKLLPATVTAKPAGKSGQNRCHVSRKTICWMTVYIHGWPAYTHKRRLGLFL